MTALPDPETTPTMTVRQAADALGLSLRNAYNRVSDGSIPSFRVGNAIRIPTAAFREKFGL